MASRVPLGGIRQHILGTNGPVGAISVTNFAASLCEVQSLYRKKKVEGQRSEAQTKALARGLKHHENLDDFESLKVPLGAQVLGEPLRLLNTAARWNRLARTGAGREIPLYGSHKGIKLYGIADGFEKDAQHKLMIVENKTTWGPLPPQEYKMRLAYHQTLMYHHMFTEMMSKSFELMPFLRKDETSAEDGDTDLLSPYLSDKYNGLCPNKLFGTDLYLCDMEGAPGDSMPQRISAHLNHAQLQLFNELNEIRAKDGELTYATVYTRLNEALASLQDKFRSMPLSDAITLRYTNNKTSEAYEIEFDKETQRQLLEYCGQLWLGEREPSPFSSDDALFCKRCEYRSICDFVARAERAGVRLPGSPHS